MFWQRKKVQSTRAACVNFSGGRVLLHVPSDWSTQPPDSPHTTARFVSPSDSVLRISIFAFPEAICARDVLAPKAASTGSVIEDLENEEALLTHSVPSDNGATETRFWHLAVSMNIGVLVLLFSYSYPSSCATGVRTHQDIELLERQIRDRSLVLDITNSGIA